MPSVTLGLFDPSLSVLRFDPIIDHAQALIGSWENQLLLDLTSATHTFCRSSQEVNYNLLCLVHFEASVSSSLMLTQGQKTEQIVGDAYAKPNYQSDKAPDQIEANTLVRVPLVSRPITLNLSVPQGV